MEKIQGMFDAAQWAVVDGPRQADTSEQKYLSVEVGGEPGMRALRQVGSFVLPSADRVYVYHDDPKDKLYHVSAEGLIIEERFLYSDGSTGGGFKHHVDRFIFYKKKERTIYTAYMRADDGAFYSLSAESRASLQKKVDERLSYGHTEHLYAEVQLFV